VNKLSVQAVVGSRDRTERLEAPPATRHRDEHIARGRVAFHMENGAGRPSG